MTEADVTAKHVDLVAAAGRWRNYLLLGWSLVVILLLSWSIWKEREEVYKSAEIEVRAHMFKDMVYREWVVERGGVYAEANALTPPNPYLKHVPERDVYTESGRLLTLVNPAYMGRLVHEQLERDTKLSIDPHAQKYFRLTSLRLINPENKPDDWEESALLAFERGEKERLQFTEFDGEPYVRLIKPLYVEKECMKCHASQGYKVGEVRGAISVAVPMAQHLAFSNEHVVTLLVEHLLLWLVGCSGIVLLHRRMHGHVREQMALEANLTKLSRAVEQAGESVLITNAQGVIEYVNPAFTRITGHAFEDAIGKTPAILNSGHQNHQFYSSMWKTISAGEVWQGRMIDRRKDGSFYPAILSIAPVRDNDGTITHYVGIQQDATRFEQLEDQLRQAQKMEALGTLVGGIAHDFNNMLAGMTGKLFLARQEISDLAPEVAVELEDAEELGFRAAEMIQQLLAFARKGAVNKEPLELREFLRHALKLSKVAIPEVIEQRYQLGEESMVVRADATQLQQVLMNLIANARDALEKRPQPQISVRLSRYIPDASFRKLHPAAKAESYACIAVADNGTGIPQEYLEHIFDPFFSTKEVGKGTGLGLAMVYGAIHSHEGVVTVDSRPGEGATIFLYLPIDTSGNGPAVQQQKKATSGSGETILVVDDNQQVRLTHSKVLERLGYQVIEAEHGEEALAVLEKDAAKVALVLMDVVMPVMSGDEAARRIFQRWPHLPVVFVTGYDRDLVIGKLEQLGPCTTLAKPVSVATLSQVVRRMIDLKRG